MFIKKRWGAAFVLDFFVFLYLLRQMLVSTMYVIVIE